MNYIYKSAILASFLSVGIAFVAVASVVFGAVFVAAIGGFLVLFPLVLLTLPAIKRLAKSQNDKLESWLSSKESENLD